MKTSELMELTATEMETFRAGATAPVTRRPLLQLLVALLRLIFRPRQATEL